MSRWASALNEAAADLDTIRGAHLLDMDFVSGHVRANDTGVELSFGGNTYPGVGSLGRFSGGEQSTEIIARGMRFELSGIAPSLLATVITQRYQGRPVRLYVGLFDDTGAFVDEPELKWSGYMDTLDAVIETRPEGGSIARIILQCEHRLRNAPPFARFSAADQMAKSPTPVPDRFFDRTHFVGGHVSTWGGRQTTFGPKQSGGYGPG